LLCVLLFTGLCYAGCATTATVSDFAANCFIDDGGVDDQPGQKDLNQFCRLPTADASTVKFAFSFDDINFRSQTGYGCILISLGAAALKPSYAVCVSVSGTNARLTNTEVLKCAPSSFTQRCIIESSASTFNTCCSVAPLNIDPFGSHNVSTTVKGLDLGVVCTIVVAEVGGAAQEPTLLNACSYASGSGSAPGDCIRSDVSCTVPERDCANLTPNACQVRACSGGFCTLNSVSDTTPCDDGDSVSCTSGQCSGGSCVPTPSNAACSYHSCPGCITAVCAPTDPAKLSDGCRYSINNFNFTSDADVARACPPAK